MHFSEQAIRRLGLLRDREKAAPAILLQTELRRSAAQPLVIAMLLMSLREFAMLACVK